MFEALMDSIERSSVNLFFRAELAPPPDVAAPPATKMETKHQEVSAYSQEGTAPAMGDGESGRSPASTEVSGRRPVQREEPKVGRNDPCPCGSGKKYKRCCGS
ncbi:MAG: SEC-C domain-containing protein [Gemmatimonadales bacterium]|nr:SEC-C domain-containing protein [Gemmatimonadales bacterium]